MEVINADSVDIIITVNGQGGDQYFMPSGTTRTIRNAAFWHLRVANQDAATASVSGKIKLTLWKAALTTDESVRERYG
jgi:hypothetical protein